MLTVEHVIVPRSDSDKNAKKMRILFIPGQNLESCPRKIGENWRKLWDVIQSSCVIMPSQIMITTLIASIIAILSLFVNPTVNVHCMHNCHVLSLYHTSWGITGPVICNSLDDVFGPSLSVLSIVQWQFPYFPWLLLMQMYCYKSCKSESSRFVESTFPSWLWIESVTADHLLSDAAVLRKAE